MQCQNTFGSYKCVCGEGLYWIDNKCQGETCTASTAERRLERIANSVDKIGSYRNVMHTGLRNSGLSYDTDTKGLIRQLGWKDLCTQRQIQKALMVYKSLNGLVPERAIL